MDAASFAEADFWIKELTEHIRKPPRLILVGNKTDREGRVINADLAEQYALSMGAAYLETSAKTGENIAVLFEAAAKSILPVEPVDGTTEAIENSGECC
jgi:GTPase SAR1 family protein